MLSGIRMTIPFSVKIEVLENNPGAWKTARVDIFDGAACKIGSYERNHSGWCADTFSPFMQRGRWFALYASDYTATRVMELPSCKDLGGEEPASHGFCPIDYYVPYDHPDVVAAGHAGQFGFIAGCLWGDDSSWKIQYLDLSDASSGTVVRKEMFGYVAMPSNALRLKDCISLDGYSQEYPRASITVSLPYDLSKGILVDPLDL